MSELFDDEVLAERARNLGPRNGLERVFVELPGPHAELIVECFNDNVLADIDTAVNVDGNALEEIAWITGGSRIPAGSHTGQVQVTALQHDVPGQLRLQVAPIGDYSTYTLHLALADGAGLPRIDPLLDTLPFKFRPGCFNANCAPAGPAHRPAPVLPDIDYLARDFESFKHVLINAMRARVLGWEPTSEADLDQVVIDLIAAEGDEQSDHLDRIFAETAIGTARKRLSLARHARLMDYHIHQGNQGATPVLFQVQGNPATARVPIPRWFGLWTGDDWTDAGAVIYATDAATDCYPILNTLDLYSWDQAVTALEAGATQADLALPAPLSGANQADAVALRNVLRGAQNRDLVIQEDLNPQTGRVNGRRQAKRQRLRLRDGDAAADAVFDPAGGGGAGRWFVRVYWRDDDRLIERYCFLTACTDQPVTAGVSRFYGNVVEATHGRPHRAVFHPPGNEPGPDDARPFIRHDERLSEATLWGTLYELPRGPLAYRETAPGGESPVRSSVSAMISGSADPWQEQSDLIESQADDAHFVVETDEDQASRLRFGNNINGRELPDDAIVTCEYQVGNGVDGNIGADQLTGFDPTAVAGVSTVWNPFDVVNGREPEPVAEIIRRVPQAYRSRQRRAVSLSDYAARAEELRQVSHAHARYAWTGSWRTVRVAIDPVGTTVLSRDARASIAAHLDALRLIGEDLEIRGARYVALDLKLTLCVAPEFWPEHLASELDSAFSDGYKTDGEPGFFHPGLWTFGQPLHASQVIAHALAIPGIERVIELRARRWTSMQGPSTSELVVTEEELASHLSSRLDVAADEVIQVANDPNHIEHGRVLFDLLGGRQ